MIVSRIQLDLLDLSYKIYNSICFKTSIFLRNIRCTSQRLEGEKGREQESKSELSMDKVWTVVWWTTFFIYFHER